MYSDNKKSITTFSIKALYRAFILGTRKGGKKMQLNTQYFGIITIDKSAILYFEEGIPGFQEYKRYVLLGQEEDSPFCWLQCVDKGDLAFALVDPTSIYPNYEPKVPKEQLIRLGEITEGSLLVYSIVTVPENIQAMTANLMAPVIIHIHTKKGMQLITEGQEYPLRYKIFEAFQSDTRGDCSC